MLLLKNRLVSVATGKLGGSTGVEFTDFRVKFKVTKTSEKEGNKAVITIYNLSQSTRNSIGEKGDLVILKAGYEENVGTEVCFVGTISDLRHSKEGVERISVITAVDGISFSSNIKMSLSLRPGSSTKTAMDTTLTAFKNGGFPVRYKTTSFSHKEYANGFSFIGQAKDCLTKICDYLDIEWNIVNSELVITDADSTVEETISLTTSSGIIGSPIKILKPANQNKRSEEKAGWKVKCLLTPSLNPKSLIPLSSEEIGENKLFKITKVVHDGDTHGAAWFSNFECTEV